jgi:hypothetical protein
LARASRIDTDFHPLLNNIIYLHIPKSGGSSQLAIFNDLYGSDRVFWHGDETSASREHSGPEDILSRHTIVGGHKAISYYPKGIEALFVSVVREPVSRVISLYSHYTKPQFADDYFLASRERLYEIWRERGMDDQSIVNSIRQCPEFRRQIENDQCRYLSRYEETLEGVIRTLEEVPHLVCALESTAAMNEILSKRLGWGGIPLRKLNRSREHTHELIMQEPGLTETLRDLLSEDQRLYEHISKTHRGVRYSLPEDLCGSTSLRSNAAISSIGSENSPWKQVQVYTKGFLGINADGIGSAGVVIINSSHIDLTNGNYPELALYYTLHSVAGDQLGDKTFSPPLNVPIFAKRHVIWSLSVKIPDQYLAEVACIKVGLAINASEFAESYNPLHVGAAHIVSSPGTDKSTP